MFVLFFLTLEYLLILQKFFRNGTRAAKCYPLSVNKDIKRNFKWFEAQKLIAGVCNVDKTHQKAVAKSEIHLQADLYFDMLAKVN